MSSGRTLSAGHAVIEIVQQKERDVQVPTAGAQEMGAADPHPAVAHGRHHGQCRSGHFQSGGIGQGPAVEAVEGMGMEEGVEEPRATDIADNGHLVAGQPKAVQGPVQGVHHLVMRASGAEGRRPLQVQQAVHSAAASII
jgi:hypothetical protein